jgi:hypothetical protein
MSIIATAPLPRASTKKPYRDRHYQEDLKNSKAALECTSAT